MYTLHLGIEVLFSRPKSAFQDFFKNILLIFLNKYSPSVTVNSVYIFIIFILPLRNFMSIISFFHIK